MEKTRFKSDGFSYKIIISQDDSTDEFLNRIKEIIIEMGSSNILKNDIILDIESQNRILSHDVQNKILGFIEQNPKITLGKFITPGVISRETYENELKSEKRELISGTIRNGQVITSDFDIIFTGQINEGGQLRSKGNIYLIGNSHGIIHAGYPNNQDALIVGDVSESTQVRIGELVKIIEKKQKYSSQSIQSVNNSLNQIESSSLF